jgi:hypothetical protein
MKIHAGTGNKNAKKEDQERTVPVGIRLSKKHLEQLGEIDSNLTATAMIKKIVVNFLEKHREIV